MRVGSKARWPSAGSFPPTLLHEDEESAEHWHRPPATAGMRAVIQRNVRLALIWFQGRREFAENCEAWVIAPTLRSHTPGRVRLSHGRYAVIYQLPGFKIYWYH